MAFKEVTNLDADTTIALGGRNGKTGKANPTSVEGYYLGSKKVESRKAKTGFAQLHIIQTAKGNVGVWGKTDLDRKLGSVTPGTMIRASHVGMQATPNGEMYKYKVEVDSDNTIEVTGTPVSGAEDSESEAFAAGNDQDEEESEFSSEDDAPAYVAEPSRQASREKVQALLSRKGTKA